MSLLGMVRLGDSSSHGGVMITATGLGKANGEAICVSGNLHQCPISGHGTTAVTSTSSATKTNDEYVLRVGDVAGCGAVITGGSSNVLSD